MQRRLVLNPRPATDHQIVLTLEVCRLNKGVPELDINHTDIPAIIAALQKFYDDVEKDVKARQITT